jgi:hypothetical protein
MSRENLEIVRAIHEALAAGESPAAACLVAKTRADQPSHKT